LTHGDRMKGAPSNRTGPRPDWQTKALCRDYPAEYWDADPSIGFVNPSAAAVCKQCPVQRECLLAGLESDKMNGDHAYLVWGGLAPKQRRAIVRARHRVGCPVCHGALLISPDGADWQVCASCGVTWRTRKRQS
jgi:hypothetical protein